MRSLAIVKRGLQAVDSMCHTDTLAHSLRAAILGPAQHLLRAAAPMESLRCGPNTAVLFEAAMRHVVCALAGLNERLQLSQLLAKAHQDITKRTLARLKRKCSFQRASGRATKSH